MQPAAQSRIRPADCPCSIPVLRQDLDFGLEVVDPAKDPLAAGPFARSATRMLTVKKNGNRQDTVIAINLIEAFRINHAFESIQSKEVGQVNIMDHVIVKKLEEKMEEAIADVILKMGLKKLPLLPARHTMHLMAKAAVTVYEAVVENQKTER